MRKRKILMLIGSACLALVLALPLVAGACAAPAPTPTPTPTPTPPPAEVYYWEPGTWANAGPVWDQLVYMAEWLDEMSDGRIKMTPSQVGAVCPVEEFAEAVSAGTTQAMSNSWGYLAGKIPGVDAFNLAPLDITPLEMKDMWDYFEGGALRKLYVDELERIYNVKEVGSYYYPLDMVLSCSFPARSKSDLEGKKFRCGDESVASVLQAFGASTVWFPGDEIYTSMATGVVDGFTFDNAYGHYANSFHEVAKYWVKKPLTCGPLMVGFIVNRDVWNGMPSDLQEMVKIAIEASTSVITTESHIAIEMAWLEVAKAGVEVIEWPEADQEAYYLTRWEWIAEDCAKSPLAADALAIVQRWGEQKGLL